VPLSLHAKPGTLQNNELRLPKSQATLVAEVGDYRFDFDDQCADPLDGRHDAYWDLDHGVVSHFYSAGRSFVRVSERSSVRLVLKSLQ
jgi:hypothetical protein